MAMIEENRFENIPCVAARELVVFPKMTVQFDVGRKESVKSINEAIKSYSGRFFLCAQRDASIEEPEQDDLFEIGTVATVKQLVRTAEGMYRCLIEGESKARLNTFSKTKNGFMADVEILPNYSEDIFEDVELTAIFRQVKATFRRYCDIFPRMPSEIYEQVLGANSPERLFEAIVFNIALPFEDRQALLEEECVGEKLGLLLSVLTKEIEIITLEHQIHEKVQENIDENQRDFYLREQIKVLKSELGTFDEGPDNIDLAGYINKILELRLDEKVEEKLIDDVKRLSKMPASSNEGVLLTTYLDTVLSLPWKNTTKDRLNIKRASQILDKDHYGMKKVKERILENLAVRELAPDVKGQIICLVGPPGVGKTSIAKSIASALGRNFVRVSLGGVRDESDIRGHRKTYIGSMPGRIINAIKIAGSKNPVILLDEIDKMGNDFKGDPSSAMLEVLDSEQNHAFIDHYIEVPFDLSEVLFVTTANVLDTIQPPLLDRMEVIELSSYTREEKFNIAKKHLIKKQLEKNGLKASQMKIKNDAIYALIDSYTREAGVRKLERVIASLCRKAAKEIVENSAEKVVFSANNLADYIGNPKYLSDYYSDTDAVGIVNGLAWTSVGGVVMPLETLVFDGTGKIEVTGSLGNVMKESAKIAVSYCRSIADKYGIDKDFYEKKDLHIHAPEGAVPKDGPSAGVTMTTAIISALSGIKVRSDVAMTGEVTLSGRVLPIGGLREKTMAAYRLGIKTVIIPEANRGDLDEVDDTVKDGVEFVFAKNIEDVLSVALVDDEKKAFSYQILNGGSRARSKLTV